MPRNRGMRERARDLVDSSKERFDDARERTEDFISENPIKSVAIAAAVGAVVAIGVDLLVRMRRRD